MKKLTEFDISDYGAQNNPGWRVRWGAEGANAVLLTDLAHEGGTIWKLLYSEKPLHVELDDVENKFVLGPDDKVIERIKEIKAIPDNCPKILCHAIADHRANIPAPRYKEPTPYITKDDAERLEHAFYHAQIAPYINTHRVYAVANSGTLLCKRLGITDYTEIYVNHYEASTYQNNRKPSTRAIEAQLIPEVDRPVLVIDDMVSSGYTADRILTAFQNLGVGMVRYAALFDIIASREIPDVDSAISTYQPVSNFYWMFGRGMDLLDEASRNYKHIYGAQKKYADADRQEDFDDLFNFFNQ